MSHQQFCRATLSRNFIMRQSYSVQLRTLHTATNPINERNKRGFLWFWWRYYCNQFIPELYSEKELHDW